jgi:hypothetical protein
MGLPVLPPVSYAYMPSPLTPAGSIELIRSSVSIASGLPRETRRSAPAISLSGPAQRSLTLRRARSRSRQNDPLHREPQQLCCLRCRLGCHRVERTSSRAEVAPAVVHRLSRRTVSTVRDWSVFALWLLATFYVSRSPRADRFAISFVERESVCERR